jgi:cholesterol transport system auxiliary component
MTPLRRLTLTLAVALLAGCSAISALNDAGKALDAYDLQAPRDLPQAARMVQRSLSIEPPATTGALDTDRILLRPNPVQSLYLPGARWSEKAPLMVQSLMLRSFEDTNALAYVGRRPLGGTGDFALVSEITDFQAELGPDGESATIRLRLTARMVREADARVLARRSFTASAPATSLDTLDMVQAFNAANDQMMREIVIWGLGAMGVSVPRG